MRKVNSLIIGAGISGLTYGKNCKGTYLIVEKDSAPGGLCRTFYQGDYVWDCSGHFFHFATNEIKEYFESRIPKNEMVRCKKNTKIYYNGMYIDFPFQMNIHQLPKTEFIDCLYDLHFRTQYDRYNNFEQMLYGRFGKSITEKFLKPYNEKLYACKLNSLDVDAMGRFFPYASETDIIKNMKENRAKSYNDFFEYPKRGAQQFIDVLLDDIDKENLLLGVRVDKIDLEKHVAEFSNGELIMYENLVNTIPLADFLKMISLEDKGEAEEVLCSNKVLVFNLGFDKPSEVQDVHWIYYPGKEFCFYRVGFYNNILGTEKMSLYVELGYRPSEDIDEDSLLQNVLEDLRKCNIITNHCLCAHNCIEMKPAYVHITKKSNDYIDALFKRLKNYDVYSIGRYGGWKYCSIEDCMLDAIDLSKMIC